MPMPKVTTSVVDLSTRVTTTGTYNAAIVVAAKKGPVDTPVLVTSQTDFLEKFTPNEKIELGWDTALLEAYIYLGQQPNLYVVRSANTTSDETPALYGGCHIRTFKSEKEHAPLDKGFKDVAEHTYMNGGVPDTKTKHYDTPEDVLDEDEDAMIIYGSSQGAYSDDLAITIITDPDQVKLDGAFIVNVYKKGVLVETKTCSLDPSLKNGYGVNCYVENVLTASKYIRADVNDNDDAIKATSYEVAVAGQVNFKNTVVDVIEKALTLDSLMMHPIEAYNVGDIRWVNDTNGGLEGAFGFYKCVTAGTTASSEKRPAFISKGLYKPSVIDGTAVWELQEIVKDYATETDYNAGDIVRTTVGANTLYYRALYAGASGVEMPKFGTDVYEVLDGTTLWENQAQTLNEVALTGYTHIKKAKDVPFDITNKLYSDLYLVTPLERDKTIFIDNPLRRVDFTKSPAAVVVDKEEKEIKYTAKYTGVAGAEHYCLPKATTEKVALYGGSDGAAPTNVENIRALKTLKNTNAYDIQLIMDGGNTTPEYQRAIDDICVYRENSCKGIISTPYVNEMGMSPSYASAQEAVVGYRKKELNANTRNLELYTTHQLVYDEFNDRNVYVSPSCFVAARIMNVAQTNGWHWASAGYNRGVINSLGVANNFDPTQVDTFSDAQINTIINEPGSGIVIFDDLNLQSQASDLQDAHISRYIDIYLRPKCKTALKSFLFEFNDEQTRMLVDKMLTTFLNEEVSARALYDYRIVVDETNNRPIDIQNSIMNVWIFVKCMKLAKWIDTKLIVTPYSVDFADAAGSVG